MLKLCEKISRTGLNGKQIKLTAKLLLLLSVTITVFNLWKVFQINVYRLRS